MSGEVEVVATVDHGEDIYRAVVEWDEYGNQYDSPREWSNPCRIYVESRNYHSPDNHEDMPLPVAIAWDRWGEGNVAMVARYLRVFHSGEVYGVAAVSAGSVTGTLSLDHDPRPGDRYDGIMVAFRGPWEECMGDETWTPRTPECIREAMDSEVKVYNQWAECDIYTARVERVVGGAGTDPDESEWEVVDSLGGIYGSDYAEEEARGMLAGEIARLPEQLALPGVTL